ncbi:MAG: hypothetical protein H0W30_04500 [Gemmatimonadaceae bacterium]|nr:hypothetical protein [Gemmatimonadaceae bacterium]
MSEPTKAPHIDPALVTWLERVFPNKCPNVSDGEREIWMAVGTQGVIANLQAIAVAQEEDSTASDILNAGSSHFGCIE